MDKYIDFCMKQVEFWENKIFELSQQNASDKIINEIDQVLKTRSVPKLQELYKRLKDLKDAEIITEDSYRSYLKYISTCKVA